MVLSSVFPAESMHEVRRFALNNAAKLVDRYWTAIETLLKELYLKGTLDGADVKPSFQRVTSEDTGEPRNDFTTL